MLVLGKLRERGKVSGVGAGVWRCGGINGRVERDTMCVRDGLAVVLS